MTISHPSIRRLLRLQEPKNIIYGKAPQGESNPENGWRTGATSSWFFDSAQRRRLLHLRFQMANFYDSTGGNYNLSSHLSSFVNQ